MVLTIIVLFAEVTDQNFVDEGTEVEKASHMVNAKRMKTSVVSTPSNDQVCFSALIIVQFLFAIMPLMLLSISHVLFQVVPLGKFPANADVSSSELK